MVYGYIRVSTDKQTVENQRFEIERFCKKEGLTIDGWIEETISGTKNYSKRALGKLLNRIVKDDLIICTELSRLGRNLFMIMEILNICMTKESRVWTIKDNYRLGDDIQSKVLAFAFGLSAEIERNLISQRTKEALARLKKEGHQVGRGQGQRNKQLNAKCVAKHKYIEGQMTKGISVPQIAKKLKIARGTLYRYLAYTGLRTPTKSRNGRWERGILLTVRFLKTNSGKKGEGMPVVRNPQFYFREGFRWSAINGTRSTNDLKFCYKSKSVNDVQGMSLCCATEAITSQYITAICNADFISKYTEGFVNSTVIFQINDCRQIPIIIPTNEELKEFENLFEEAKMIMLKWDESSMIKLKELKECLNKAVLQLYRLR